MAGIATPIRDILAKLATVPGINYVRIWNNQLQNTQDGKIYDYPKPAVFLETINDVQFQQLGVGMQSADVGFRVHIIHEYYDAQDGTFEQDLVVFELRDAVKATLSLHKPPACGPLVQVAETQDYDHNNLYHYIMDFLCNFTDSKGSPLDPARTDFIEKPAPTDLVINVNAVDSIAGQTNEQYRTFTIPQ